jgi:hypothetical protein
LRLAELRSLHSGAVDRTEVAVEAAQFGATAGKWADSGVTVEEGVGLVVAASGRVDLTPAQAGQHVSEPAGYQAQGSDGGYRAGTLLGRIGEEGEVFIIGPRYESRSAKGGRLYVRIVPLAGGNGSTGSYQVKVSTGPGVELGTKGNSPTPARSPYSSLSSGPTGYSFPPGLPMPAGRRPR